MRKSTGGVERESAARVNGRCPRLGAASKAWPVVNRLQNRRTIYMKVDECHGCNRWREAARRLLSKFVIKLVSPYHDVATS